MKFLVKKKEYLIFSDDTDWCKKENLFKNKNFYFAGDYTNGSESLDLNLLSLCDSHLIANSSFSWWGSGCLHKKGLSLQKIGLKIA